jgi:hypothetical protein
VLTSGEVTLPFDCSAGKLCCESSGVSAVFFETAGSIVRFKKAGQRLTSNISVLSALIDMIFCMWSYISNVPKVLYNLMLQVVYFNCNG